MARHAGAITLGGVGLAAVIAGGNGAREAAEAVEITMAVLIVLAVTGLAAALAVRVRARRRIGRQSAASGPLRVRAEVIGRTRPLPPSRAPRAGEGGSGGGRGNVAPGHRAPDAARLAIGPPDPGEGHYRRTPGVE